MDKSRIESPEFIQTSLGAAMALDLVSGRFYRDAKPKCANLLLTYGDGCAAGCKYCGLGAASSRARATACENATAEGPADGSFIRVQWPVYSTDVITRRLSERAARFARVCVSMVTHRRCFRDTLDVVSKLKAAVLDLPVSVLVAPSTMPHDGLMQLRQAGVDMIGIGLDAANPRIFRRLRPNHSWERYLEITEDARAVFGPHKVSVHLIAGLGESDKEMMETVARVVSLGACAHLFSFYPEAGSEMEMRRQPPLRRYRRMQLARYLLQNRLIEADGLGYDDRERLLSIDAPAKLLSDTIRQGKAFMTNGCPSRTGELACNRPFANERPSQRIRNFPFPPTEEDIEAIASQLRWTPVFGFTAKGLGPEAQRSRKERKGKGLNVPDKQLLR